MCSKGDLEKINGFLAKNTGVERGLCDWQQDINAVTKKRLTRRELASAFRKVALNVHRETGPARYLFS